MNRTVVNRVLPRLGWMLMVFLIWIHATGGAKAQFYTVEGAVYEDVNGDGSLADAVPVPNASVILYRDNGDGVPDAGDIQIQNTSTSSLGAYSFQNLPNGDYWVAVDSRTVSPSAGFNGGFAQGDVWAEQTYGAGGAWGGALCDDDADGSTPASARTTNGVCFGGRRGNRSDDASALASAEHVAHVRVDGSTVAGVDFGFSFNVVTNANDQDDDSSNNRSAQGSLRQFIQNADAITGANEMRFVPAVPANSASWWTVTLQSGQPLPQITDDSTTVDGRAYSYTDGTSVRDTNAGSVFAPGPVGVSQTFLGAYAMPELEVDVNDTGDGLTVAADHALITRVALYNSNAALVRVTSGSQNAVRDSFLGSRADGSDPGPGGGRSLYAVRVRSGANMDVVHSYIAHLSGTGILLQGTGVVEQNFIEHLGLSSACADAVTFEGGPLRSRTDVVARYNYMRDLAAYGVESWRAPGAYTVQENTITDTGKGDSSGHYCGGSSINTSERGGIRIFGSGSLVQGNVIHHVPGHAVVVEPRDASTPSQRNTISQNSTYQNGGLSIDLDQGDGSGNPNGDGVSPNDGQTSSQEQNEGLDYPVFTKAELAGSNLTLEGFIGTPANKLQPAAGASWTVELFVADDDGNNNGEVFAGDGASEPHGEGKTYLQSFTLSSSDFASGVFTKILTVVGLSPGQWLTATLTDENGNTSEFGANVQVLQVTTSVSGELYHDREPNGQRDSGDPSVLPTSPLYVKRFADPDGDCSNGFTTPAEEVVGVNASGGYTFAAVPAGSYCLVLAGNNDPNDASAYDSGPDGWLYINPPDGVLTLVVTPQQAAAHAPSDGNDYGLFHGAQVSGTVFYDTGDGAGTANDALQNGTEPGVPGVRVSASDGSQQRSVLTDANGNYAIYIPADWGAVSLSQQARPASGYNNPSAAQQATDWNDANAATDPDHTAFSQLLGSAASLAGQVLAGRNFGVVRRSVFQPDQQGTSPSPGVVSYSHSYKPGTEGTVTLKRTGGSYVYQVRVDADCNGTFDAGEPWWDLSATSQPSFDVTDAWPRGPDGAFRACAVEVRVLVPPGESQGAVDLGQVEAELAWDQNPGVLDRGIVVDTTTVRVQGALVLEKVVRNVTQNVPPSGYDTTVSGRPGEVLEYCIRYHNIGAATVQNVQISDPVPFFVDVVTDAYDTDPALDETLLWNDASGTVHRVSAAADGDAGEVVSGLVTLRAEAVLQPGSGGELCYRVRVR